MHEEANKIALNTTLSEPTSLAEVQALDRVYYTESFYLRRLTNEEHERMMMFVKLRQLELLLKSQKTILSKSSQISAGRYIYK